MRGKIFLLFCRILHKNNQMDPAAPKQPNQAQQRQGTTGLTSGLFGTTLLSSTTAASTASLGQPQQTTNSLSVQDPSTHVATAAVTTGGFQNILPVNIARGLADKLYEKRKSAALEVEKLVRDALVANDSLRIKQLLHMLTVEYAYSIVPNTRNGGLIALAAVAIALGSSNVSIHLPSIVPPILACFSDQDSRVRYYACEAMYNVSKVSRAHILLYFNEIFDALCKLSVDQEISVKSGAGLLDRIIKDIVAERSTYYYPNLASSPPTTHATTTAAAVANEERHPLSSPEPPLGKINTSPVTAKSNAGASQSSVRPVVVQEGLAPSFTVPGTTPLTPGLPASSFNLPRFIPLLSERIYAVTPSARIFLVQWIYVLNSIPDLELISYLPEFLDGLFCFLSDPNVDVRTATLNVLGEFLKEIRDVVHVQQQYGGPAAVMGSSSDPTSASAVQQRLYGHPGMLGPEGAQSGSTTDLNLTSPVISNKTATTIRTELDALKDTQQQDPSTDILQQDKEIPKDSMSNPPGATTVSAAAYIPGQNVTLDFGQMTRILVPHLSSPDEEIQATALKWLHEFILLVRNTMIPYTPLFLKALLRTLSHSVVTIRTFAIETNSTLFTLVYEWNGPTISSIPNLGTSQSASVFLPEHPANDLQPVNAKQLPPTLRTLSTKTNFISDPASAAETGNASSSSSHQPRALELSTCVSVLTRLLQDDKEETRAAAMDWLSMLHRKEPRQTMQLSDEQTFQALLGALSDLSEDVVKRDLQLLAQILYQSDDHYFSIFIQNLLLLFSKNRRLLESRGSLIIRQLCFSLSPERMYRCFAEILENESDLGFASMMVQNLNMILTTAPELSELRKRLKNLDTKDGSALFATLYRSWCHSAVSAFSLCLLAQAYEHASVLVASFGDLEITVPFLVQIDKLVQLIESPVFTSLRLQLLEPDRYPFLFKSLYGILMLLPQSSAFATLRNRLSSVSSLITLYNNQPNGLNASSIGNLQSTNGGDAGNGGSGRKSKFSSRGGRSTPPQVASDANSGTSPSGSDVNLVKWNELIGHFRSVQHKQERYRRHASRQAAVASTTERNAGMAGSHASGVDRSNSVATYASSGGAAAGRQGHPYGTSSRRASFEADSEGYRKDRVNSVVSASANMNNMGVPTSSHFGPPTRFRPSMTSAKNMTPPPTHLNVSTFDGSLAASSDSASRFSSNVGQSGPQSAGTSFSGGH